MVVDGGNPGIVIYDGLAPLTQYYLRVRVKQNDVCIVGVGVAVMVIMEMMSENDECEIKRISPLGGGRRGEGE